MPTFKCKIATPDGRIITRRLIASNKGSLKDSLEREGNFVLQIQRVEGVLSIFRLKSVKGKIKPKDFLTFNQEFSVLIKAGLPILSALDAIIKKGGNDDLIEILKEIRSDIAGGESLSAAFGKYRHIFSGLYIASLQAGEKSGNLAMAIYRHILYLKKIQEIRQKVVTASVYPAILTCVSIFALMFLLMYVVPTFTKTYFEAGTKLPAITLALVNFTHMLRANFLLIIISLLLMIIGWHYFRKTETGAMFLDKMKISVPFFGDLYLHYYLSKLARTLAMVLSGGTALLEAVRISTGALKNRYIRQKLDMVTRKLEQGSGFSESLSDSKVFPDLAVRMIDAGESSGALEQVLDDLAEFYENDVDTRLSVITSAIEPGLMIIMGLLIGFVVLAMYLPIFQMASAVG